MAYVEAEVWKASVDLLHQTFATLVRYCLAHATSSPGSPTVTALEEAVLNLIKRTEQDHSEYTTGIGKIPLADLRWYLEMPVSSFHEIVTLTKDGDSGKAKRRWESLVNWLPLHITQHDADEIIKQSVEPPDTLDSIDPENVSNYWHQAVEPRYRSLYVVVMRQKPWERKLSDLVTLKEYVDTWSGILLGDRRRDPGNWPENVANLGHALLKTDAPDINEGINSREAVYQSTVSALESIWRGELDTALQHLKRVLDIYKEMPSSLQTLYTILTEAADDLNRLRTNLDQLSRRHLGVERDAYERLRQRADLRVHPWFEALIHASDLAMNYSVVAAELTRVAAVDRTFFRRGGYKGQTPAAVAGDLKRAAAVDPTFFLRGGYKGQTSGGVDPLLIRAVETYPTTLEGIRRACVLGERDPKLIPPFLTELRVLAEDAGATMVQVARQGLDEMKVKTEWDDALSLARWLDRLDGTLSATEATSASPRLWEVVSTEQTEHASLVEQATSRIREGDWLGAESVLAGGKTEMAQEGSRAARRLREIQQDLSYYPSNGRMLRAMSGELRRFERGPWGSVLLDSSYYRTLKGGLSSPWWHSWPKAAVLAVVGIALIGGMVAAFLQRPPPSIVETPLCWKIPSSPGSVDWCPNVEAPVAFRMFELYKRNVVALGQLKRTFRTESGYFARFDRGWIYYYFGEQELEMSLE